LLGATPLKGDSRACWKRIVEALIAPEHLKSATDRAIVMSNNHLGTVGILERHVLDASHVVRRNVKGTGDSKLTKMSHQVVIIRKGHVARGRVYRYYAQAIRAAASVRSVIGVERDIPEFDCSGKILHRLHKQINRVDRRDRRARRALRLV